MYIVSFLKVINNYTKNKHLIFKQGYNEINIYFICNKLNKAKLIRLS